MKKERRKRITLAKTLLDELGDNEEVLMSGEPTPQLDAKEPRYKLTIIGPKRLVQTLFDRIADGISRTTEPKQQPLFSGTNSNKMWGEINHAKNVSQLSQALYGVCCRLQDLEGRVRKCDSGSHTRTVICTRSRK